MTTIKPGQEHDPEDERLHAAPSDDFTAPADPEDDDGTRAGYKPPGVGGERIALNTPKRTVKTLDRKKVAYVLVAVAVLIGFAMLQAFSPKKGKQPGAGDEAVTTNAPQAEGLNALPSNYGDYAKAEAEKHRSAPQLGAPMPGELGATELANQRGYGVNTGQGPQTLTEIQRLQQQQELERLKRAQSAQEARPSFDQQGGGTLAQALPPAAAPTGVPPYPQFPGPTPPDKSSRDADNRQDDKLDFTKSAGAKDASPYLTARLIQPTNLNVVQAGAQIPALFLTGVNSDLPGLVTAQVSQDVYDTPTGRNILIPQGAKLIGEYDSRVTYGQDRVLLVWTRILFPNGSSISLEGMPGVDMSGFAGVQDKVYNHWGKIIGAVLLSSTLSVAAATSQGSQVNAFNQSSGQLAAQGAGQSINQAGEKIVQRELNVQPTLVIRPGQRVAVMVDKDIELPPYGR